MTKYQRIQYVPDDETEAAIVAWIAELERDKKITLSRTTALSHFVTRGVRDWKRDHEQAHERN
jgi:hypothetical protein